jgi:hypothetical protein
MRKLWVKVAVMAIGLSLLAVAGAWAQDGSELLPPGEPLPPDKVVEHGEETERGIEFPIDFLVGFSKFLLGQVSDCETGQPVPASHIKVEFYFEDDSKEPYGLADLEKVVVRAPGYTPYKITQFSSFSVSLLILQITFLVPDPPNLCLAASELPWSASRPLTWDDFQGEPPEDADERDEAAEISMWLGYTYQTRVWFDRDSGKWKVHLTSVTTTNTMGRDRSWAVQGQRTPALLNHEQKHFDLNEVYRRLLDAALQKLVCKLETSGSTRQEAEEEMERRLREVFDKHRKKCDEVQEQYDRQTDHGRDAAKQQEWDRKISDWLADPSKAPKP